MAAPEMCPHAGSIVSPGNQSSGGALRVTRVRAECGNAGGKDARTAEPWAGSACDATLTLKREGCGFSPSVLTPPATDRGSAGWLRAQATVRAVRGRPLPPVFTAGSVSQAHPPLSFLISLPTLERVQNTP